MKKRVKLEELLSEDVGYTPEKAKHIIDTAERELPSIINQFKRLYNMFSSITIQDLLEGGREQLKKYEKAAEVLDKKVDTLKNTLEDISNDMYDIGEKNLSNQSREIDSKYWEFSNQIEGIKSVIDQLDTTMMDWDDENIVNLVKNFKN